MRARRQTVRKGLGWFAILVLVLGLLTQSAGAAPAVRGDAVIDQAQAKKEEIRRQKADLAGQLDVAKASTNEVADALTALDTQVAAQQSKVTESTRAIDDAQRRIDELEKQLGDNRAEVDRITEGLRKQALRRYVKPEGDVDAASLLKSDNFDEAEQRKALAQLQWGSSQDSVDQLRGAKARLADLQQQTDDAKREADARRADQQTQLDSLNASRSSQARVKAEWDNRVAGMQDSAAELNTADAQLSQIITTQQNKLQAEAAARAAAAEKAKQQATASKPAPSNGGSGNTGGGTSGGTSGGGSSPSPAPAPAPAPSSGNGKGMIWPIAGRVSQEYGHNGHPGIDIFAPLGTPIWAALSGTVIYAQFNDGGYGNLVVVDHGGGFSTAYAHQSQIMVSDGQSVSQGQVLGLEGSTGNSTGPHLHFECRMNGATQNPRMYLP